MKRIFTILFLFTGFISVFAQMDKYHIDGDMKDGFTDMSTAFVLVYVNGQKLKRISAIGNGTFDFDLEFGKNYELQFFKQGYATKKVDILLQNVTAEMVGIGCRSREVQVSMIQKVDGIDYSVLDKSVGQIFFDPEVECFDWDADYTLKAMKEIDKLVEELEEKKDNYAKNKAAGDKALSKGDFEAAKDSYQAALAAMPKDEAAEKMILEVAKKEEEAKNTEATAKAAEEAKAVAEAEKVKKDEFDKIVAAGDKALKAENFEEAAKQYEAATKLMPDQTSVKTKLQIVEETKKKRAAAAALEEEAKQKAQEEAAAGALAEEEAKKKAKEAATVAKAAEEAEKSGAEAAKKKAKEEDEAAKITEKVALDKEKEAKAAAKGSDKEQAKAEKEKALAEEKAAKEVADKKAADERSTAEAKEKQEEEAKKIAAEKVLEEEKKKKEPVIAAKKKPKKEEKKPEPKKEVPKKEVIKKAIPKPSIKKPPVKKSAVAVAKPKAAGAGTAAAKVKLSEHAEKKKELYASAKKVTKPKDKHDDIHALLDKAAVAQNPTTTSIHEHHDWNMKQPGVHEEIATEYPVGVTEEIYMKGNKEILERVVVKDGLGSIYWRVKHSWGGVYHFKNANVAITSIEFDLFTRIKDVEGNVVEPYHIDRVNDH